MAATGIIGIVIIITNIAFSYKGFKDHSFFEKYKFEVEKILLYKDYKRLISSGFLHANWQHLAFNMLSLYFFSSVLEYSLGEIPFLIIYFCSLVGGNLLTLFIHRNHGDYSAVGASGAVLGVIFASIVLFPGMSFFFGIPGWMFGIAYIGLSIYGIKSQTDNIGHEAHLGGALAGMLTTLVMHPSALAENYITVLILTVPTIVFIYLVITRPHILLVDNFFFKTHKKNYSIDHLYNENKIKEQKDIDGILDKINKKGIKSLTAKEKQMLEEYSKTLH